MKLLVITDSYPPHHSGGYELRSKDILDCLGSRKHEIVVLTTKCPMQRCDLHQGERNIYRELHKDDPSKGLIERIYSEYQDIKLIHDTITSFKPDLIYLFHVINLTRTIYPYLADRTIPIVFDEGGKGIAWAWSHHGIWYNFIENRGKSFIKNASKEILGIIGSGLSSNVLKRNWRWPKRLSGYFNSHSGMEYARGLGVPLPECSVIHSGLSLREFPFVPKTRIGSPIQLLLPGRIAEIKGQKDIIQVLLRLKEENLQAHATIVGAVFSDAYYGGLVQEIDRHGLGSQISMLPKVEHGEMKDLYQAADICFFPSYQKFGFSRIPLEAMASGCLVISYGNEDSCEIIDHNETGFIVPEGDCETMVQIVQQMVLSPHRYGGILQQARARVEKSHEIGKYIDKIERFLNQAILEQHGTISS